MNRHSRYSLAEARANLPSIVRQAERGEPVKITRRGSPVAVLLSIQEHHRLCTGRPRFAMALKRYQDRFDGEDVTLERGYFTSLRDRSSGRDVKL